MKMMHEITHDSEPCFSTAISIIFGIVICVVHLGAACPRKPLWDVGDIAENLVNPPSFSLSTDLGLTWYKNNAA